MTLLWRILFSVTYREALLTGRFQENLSRQNLKAEEPKFGGKLDPTDFIGGLQNNTFFKDFKIKNIFFFGFNINCWVVLQALAVISHLLLGDQWKQKKKRKKGGSYF